MLSRDSLNAALPLTTILDSADVVLVPIPGTPLEAMVKATRSDPNFNVANGSTYVPDVASIEYIANAKDETLGQCQHDVVADDVIEVVSNAVKNHISFAKNVVTPAIEELVSKTEEMLKQMTPASLLGMEVIIHNPPKPMFSSSLEDAVRKFEELPFDVPVMKLNLPNLTAKEITELMMSGSGGLDAYIAEWAAVKGESFFINLWENVFQMKPTELNGNTLSFRDWIYGTDESVDNALAIYLLARRIADRPLPETQMSLPVFEKSIIEFRNHAAARLCTAFDDMAKVDKIQQLVRSYTKNTVTVNGSVYNKWIEAGGENEVLFGNLMDLPAATTVGEINSKKDGLLMKWKNYALLTATAERNKTFVRTKEVLRKVFTDSMRTITEGEESTLANREAIIKLFDEQLDRVREDELTDIWMVCLKLVCRSRFYRTEAERILLGIERVRRENPNIDIREAATVSVIEYVAYWVSTQFSVHACGGLIPA